MKTLQNAALRRIGRRATILTIIFLLQVAMFSSFVEADSTSFIPSIKLKHSIQIRSGGLVIVNETITLFNNSTEPISSFQIGFPRDFTSNLDGVKALELDGKELSVARNITLGEDSIYWMNVSFYPEAIKQNEVYNFSISFAFSGLFAYIGSDPPVYGAIFPKYPALILNAEYCEVEISLPSGATFEGSSWESLHHVERPLQAYSKETGYVSFSGNIQLIEGDSARREIVLDAYSNAFFYDSYNIRNIGQTRISSMSFIVPKAGKDLTVYDPLGPLSFTVKEEGEAKIVNVAFRYPLRGEEGTIGYYDSASLTLKYKLETQPHMTQESWSAYKLRTKLFVNVDWTIKELIVKITLPEGAEFIRSSLTNNDLSKNAFTQSITYMIQRVTPIHNLDITIEYRYIMFWSAFRPALWMGIIVAVIGAVVAFRRHKRTIPMAISSESTALIRSFVEACDERMTLWIELRSLEKDVEDDRIRKKDYNRRRRIVDQRLHLITKEFTNLKEKIRQLEPRFSELVNRIEAAETEIRTLEADINGLRTQYRSGKLSRNAYEKLRDSYERRIERAKVVIEGIIIDLKGEVG